MKNQVLNIKQMQHLKELGVDISKGSMVWLPYREMKGSPEIPIELCDKYYHLEFAYSLRPILPEEEMLYTFTLQDIIDKLPKRIETEDYEFELYIYYHENGVSVFYDDGDITQLAFFSKPTLLESAYEMLCWCIEKGYIKTN